MVILGLGLGMVMQVLVLAVQNAVPYEQLGVATSGSTLFRQVGGSIGVALFGAIFANRLATELAGRLPVDAPVPNAVSPTLIERLPPAIHELYLEAFSAALTPVFAFAAAASAVAFALTWLLREVPLRKTASSEGLGESFASPRDDSSFRELERSLSVLARRENRWHAYEEFASVPASSCHRRSCGCSPGSRNVSRSGPTSFEASSTSSRSRPRSRHSPPVARGARGGRGRADGSTARVARASACDARQRPERAADRLGARAARRDPSPGRRARPLVRRGDAGAHGGPADVRAAHTRAVGELAAARKGGPALLDTPDHRASSRDIREH